MHYQMTSIGEMAKLYQERCLIDSNEVNCNFQKCTKLSGTYDCSFHRQTESTPGFVRIFEQLDNIFPPVTANLVATRSCSSREPDFVSAIGGSLTCYLHKE